MKMRYNWTGNGFIPRPHCISEGGLSKAKKKKKKSQKLSRRINRKK